MLELQTHFFFPETVFTIKTAYTKHDTTSWVKKNSEQNTENEWQDIIKIT